MDQAISLRMRSTRSYVRHTSRWVIICSQIIKGIKYEPTSDDVISWIKMADSDGDGRVTL